MSVKNAIRILIGRFGVVWGIMLFVAVYLVILISASLVFTTPMVAAFREAGLFDRIEELFGLMLNSAFTLNNVIEKIEEIWASVTKAYQADVKIQVNTFLLITLVIVLLNKFLIGFYELPALECLEHKMSSNAKLSFFGRFVANLRRSLTFVLMKMLYAIIADAIIIVIIYGLFQLWGLNPALTLFLPFIIMIAIILLLSLRYSLFAGWGPAMVTGKKKVLAAFRESVVYCFNNFGRTFGGMVIAWTLIIVVNVLFGLLTVWAALVLTIPASMALSVPSI
ncbi:MAG: hypothetical protein FWE84_06215 [Firmicutes bacterium]|nr:hypothetical protein [Bacillota bacterium]